MGCGAGGIEIDESLYGPKKKNIYNLEVSDNLSEIKKKQLFDLIQRDDVAQMALLDNQKQLILMEQISEEGLYWLMSHFCCRWDSSKCLEYMLKKMYTEQPSHYISYVNQTTAEMWTCLHLCAIFHAKKCFGLLINFGGVNFTIQDWQNKTPFSLAKDHHHKQMAQTLKKFKKIKLKFSRVNHEQLSKGLLVDEKDYNQQDFETTQDLKRYEIKIDPSIMGIIGQISEKKYQRLNQLVEEKTKLERQRDEIIKKQREEQEIQRRQKQKLKQQKKQKTKEKIQILETQENYVLLQLFQQQQKVQDQKRLESQILLFKQKQINQIKIKLQQFQSDQIRQQIDSEQLKLEQITKENQQKLKQRLENNKSKLIANVQKLKKKSKSTFKNVVNQAVAKEKSQKKQQSGQIPQSLKSIYEEYKAKGQFNDPSFPANSQSIGDSRNSKFESINKKVSWLRPKQIFGSEYQLFDGIDANDIKQGQLGVCYYLATISALAMNPDNIRKMFVFEDKQIGFYILKMYINGLPQLITLDDKIPCNKSTKIPVFTKPVGKQIWVCLLQKALAKKIGSYLKAQAMTPHYMMQDLTGAPSYGKWFQNKKQQLQSVIEHQKKGHIVVLTSLQKKKIQGITNNHAYTLLGSYQYQGEYIFKLRNPWGNFQWKGKFDQSSSFWTTQLKNKVSHSEEDDGIFFMSQGQLLQAFIYFSVCLLIPKYENTAVQIDCKIHQDTFYKFTLPQDSDINLKITQLFDRMINDKAYKYSPVIFQVGHIQSDGTVNFITQGNEKCNWGDKSVHAEENVTKLYKKGSYIIRIQMMWKQDTKYNKAVLSCYSKHKVNFQRIAPEQGIKLWKQLAISFMKNQKCNKSGHGVYAMTWMRGQMICYGYLEKDKQGDTGQMQWTFEPSKFVNCKLANSAINEKILKFPIGFGPKNANIGSVTKTIINQACSSGSVRILIQKK